MTTQTFETPADLMRRIKVALFDSDGVLFPATQLMGAARKEKLRFLPDGQGISLLRAAGIRIAFITAERGESSAALRETVEKWNSLPSSQPQTPVGWPTVAVYDGCIGAGKLEAANEFVASAGLTLNDCAFMGDDLGDAALLRHVALPTAPQQAELVVKKLARWVAPRPGGLGAIRDFADAVLEARGMDPLSMTLQ